MSGEAICSILLKNKNPVLAYREAAGISQQKLADAIGVSNVMISKIEKGKTKSGIAMFAIAKFFNVDLNELIGS